MLFRSTSAHLSHPLRAPLKCPSSCRRPLPPSEVRYYKIRLYYESWAVEARLNHGATDSSRSAMWINFIWQPWNDRLIKRRPCGYANHNHDIDRLINVGHAVLVINHGIDRLINVGRADHPHIITKVLAGLDHRRSMLELAMYSQNHRSTVSSMSVVQNLGPDEGIWLTNELDMPHQLSFSDLWP